MRTPILALALVGFSSFLSGPSSAQSGNSSQPPSNQACPTSADSAAIYSLALRESLLRKDDGKTRIVLLSQTSGGFPPGMAASTSFGANARKDLLDTAAADTKSDFQTKAGLQCDVPTNIEPRERIVFVTPNQMDALFPKGAGDWGAFGKKYPRAAGFTLVSAIGFNASQEQALVYVGHSCGMLCGSGYLVLLAKKQDKWEVQKIANIWVS